MSQASSNLSSEESSVYTSLFKSLDKEGLGIVTGEVSRPIFEKSGLSTTVLREIWQLSDPEGNGFLTENGFYTCLRLIGHVQHGAQPNLALASASGPVANLSGSVSTQSIPRPISTQFSGTPTGGSRVSSFQGPAAAPVFPPLTQQDVSKFGALFHKTAPSGMLSGEQAKAIFLKANLPTPILGQIWNLVDRRQLGNLSQQEFTIAMYLIQNKINGSLKQIPQFVPETIWQIAGSQSSISANSTGVTPVAQMLAPQRQTSTGSVSTAGPEWTITPVQKQQYDSIFDSLDSKKAGVLSPNEIAQLLMTSNLPQETLGAIWDLADIGNTGEFTKKEFSIALYLVNRKLAGGDLPDIVPESLIQSAGQGSSLPRSHQQPQQLPQSQEQLQSRPAQTQVSKSSLNDLASLNDLFSSPVVTPPVDKTHPELHSAPTGTRAPFVPSSKFGQQFQSEHRANEPKQASLIEHSDEESEDDDEGPVSAEPPKMGHRPVIPAREQKPQFSGERGMPATSYDALSAISSQPTSKGFTSQPAYQATNPAAPVPVSSAAPAAAAPATTTRDADLLADPEVSGQLSAATMDTANLSNQINSLTSQTTQLNDKRERATNELNRILALKRDIEGKLSKLRVLYEQEVKQVQEVETVLAQSKQETAGLEKEASLMEANYHATQAKLQQSQVAYEESQKHLEILKEKLGVMNAEHQELQNQHEQKQQQQKQMASMLSVTQQQVSVLETKNNELRSSLEATNKDVSAVEEQHEIEKSKLESLKAEIPLLTAAISTAAATVAMTKSAMKGTASSIDYHQQKKKDLEDKHAQLQKDSSSTAALEQSNAEVEGTKEIESSVPESANENDITDKLQSMSVDSPTSNTRAASSAQNTTETPVSSPAGSEIQYTQQFQNFNLPLGRPHSTTSSVANNPPQSVRGEDNVSEPASPSLLEEDIATPTGTAPSTQHLTTDTTENANPDLSGGESQGEEAGDAFPSSSTGESFEIVEAENEEPVAKEAAPVDEGQEAAHDTVHTEDQSSSNVTIQQADANEAQDADISDSVAEQAPPALSAMPGGFAFDAPSPAVATEEPTDTLTASNEDEEFPPIRELDYSESDSSDEEGDQFHDTSATVEKAPQPAAGDEFEDLEPAAEEATKGADDLFDEFAGLEEAAPEDQAADSTIDDEGYDAFTQGFSDSTALQQQQQQQFSFDQLEPSTAETNNDEWDKLFEGFGNSQAGGNDQQQQQQPQAFSFTQPVTKSSPTAAVGGDSTHTGNQAHDLAIEELAAMGFDKASAIKALTEENWNLENATNRLLDSA